MLSNMNFLLVTVTCVLSICTAIRVDWNTNTGPIIPPTPRTTVKPVPPFREPAPVWEDLSNDIPNPNPYIYVPPPPSRPKQRLNTNVNYVSKDSSSKIYGTIVTPQNFNSFYQQNNNNNSPQVASLSPQYIPNVGTRYVAVVPTSSATKSSVAVNKYHLPISSSNALSTHEKNSYKLQGKYNAKTKKYKAYEKVKYVPPHYYSSFEPKVKTTAEKLIFLGDQKLGQLQASDENIEVKWSSHDGPLNGTATYPLSKFLTKRMSAKNKWALKSKEKFSDLVVLATNS